MGHSVTVDTSETVTVTREDGSVAENYTAGENFTVAFSGSTSGIDLVYETNRGSFDKSLSRTGCSGLRVRDYSTVSLRAPTDRSETGDMYIWAGWASGYSTVHDSLLPEVGPLIDQLNNACCLQVYVTAYVVLPAILPENSTATGDDDDFQTTGDDDFTASLLSSYNNNQLIATLSAFLIPIAVALVLRVDSVRTHAWTRAVYHRLVFHPYDQNVLALRAGDWLIVLAYLACNLALLFVDDGNSVYSAERKFHRSTGYAATMNLLFVSLPMTKVDSILPTLLGISHERIVRFHRLLGHWAILTILLHMYYLNKSLPLMQYLDPDVAWNYGHVAPLPGFLAACCFLTMWLFALPPVRRWAYEVFRFAHLLFIPAVILAALHDDWVATCLIPPAVLHIVDKAFNWYKTLGVLKGLEVEECEALSLSASHPDLGSKPQKWTKIVLKNGKGLEFRPCDFATIFVPALGTLGGTSALMPEWHPFSIAAAPSSGKITFCIKAMGPGTFTQRLHDHVEGLKSKGEKLTLQLGGIYDGRPATRLSDYERVIMVAGGIGITPFISTLGYLLHQGASQGATKQKTRTLKSLALIWTCPFESQLRVFEKELVAAEQEAQEIGVELTVSLFTSQDGTVRDGDMAKATKPAQLGRVIGSHRIAEGRPNIPSLIRDLVAGLNRDAEAPVHPSDVTANDIVATITHHRTSAAKTCVMACGPDVLLSQVKSCCQKEGIDLSTEVFYL